jgi:hypothetical protein
MGVQNCTHIGRLELKKSIIIDIGYGGPPHGGMYRSTVNAVEGSPVYLDK